MEMQAFNTRRLIMIGALLIIIQIIMLISTSTGLINYNTKDSKADRFFVSAYVLFSVYIAISNYN